MPTAFQIHVRCHYLVFIQDSYSYVRSTASAVGYDSKQYYQQPTATAAVAAAQPQPSVADSYYQSGMGEYSLFPLVVCLTITSLGVLTAPCGLNTPPEAFFSFQLVCSIMFIMCLRVASCVPKTQF